MSTTFGRLLPKQIETFMSYKQSTKLSGFCNKYNTQYYLTQYNTIHNNVRKMEKPTRQC